MTFSLNADMLPAQDFPPVRTLSTPESGFFNKPPDSSNNITEEHDESTK